MGTVVQPARQVATVSTPPGPCEVEVTEQPEPEHPFAFEDPPDGPSTNDPRGGPIVANMWKAAEQPGQWARVATYDNGRAASLCFYNLKAGKQAKRRPPGEWEFNRAEVDGKFVVYARLISR